MKSRVPRQCIGFLRVLTWELDLLPGDRRADRTNASGIVLTRGSRHIGGELGAEIQADERRRDHGCGDRETANRRRAGRPCSDLSNAARGERKEAGLSRRGGAAWSRFSLQKKFIVFLQKIFIAPR